MSAARARLYIEASHDAQGRVYYTQSQLVYLLMQISEALVRPEEKQDLHNRLKHTIKYVLKQTPMGVEIEAKPCGG